MNDNDKRILALREEIRAREENLENPGRFTPVTNCMISLDGISCNINVTLPKLLALKLEMYYSAAIDHGYNPEDIIISDYPLTDWMHDVSQKMAINDYKAECEKLKKLKAQLDKLLSSDMQTSVKIDEIAALIG